MRRFFEIGCWLLLIAMMAGTVRGDEGAILKGKVEFDSAYAKSWDGHELTIPFSDIPAELFERVDVPPVPVPKNWTEMKPEEQQKWATEYEASPEGQKFIDDRDKIIDDAHRFEVKIEKNGRFTIFDVPPGMYGLRGRADKEVGGTRYGFEVFGQIEVLKEMDEVRLDPIQIAITPLLDTGAPAPPIEVKTHDDKSTLALDNFKENYLFVSFWITTSPNAEYQLQVQKMFTDLKDKHPLNLLSICVDEDRKAAIKYIIEKELREGSHGFTDGFNHRSLFDYGVRTIPSFWLIGPDGKISMTQYDFARSFRLESDLSVIVSNRIEGKDLPTPATPPAAPSEADAEKAKAAE